SSLLSSTGDTGPERFKKPVILWTQKGALSQSPPLLQDMFPAYAGKPVIARRDFGVRIGVRFACVTLADRGQKKYLWIINSCTCPMILWSAQKPGTGPNEDGHRKKS
ncbi:MAG: hypothetical protein IH796_07765, partial [Deltaproteobacteria bacterium]|nr:hypothetical protein [Deltaproteobacteria bacterium]